MAWRLGASAAEHRLINYDWEAKSCLLPAFINKVLFERSHEHPLTAHSYFRSIPTEIAGPSKPKTATTWRFTGNVCGPLHQSNAQMN